MVCEVGYIVCPPMLRARGGPNGFDRKVIFYVVDLEWVVLVEWAGERRIWWKEEGSGRVDFALTV